MSKSNLHPQLAARLNQAAEQHPRCPKKHVGRLRWVQQELHARGVVVSIEAVRKWFAGEGRPQDARGNVLANLLDVDAAWLMWGGQPAGPQFRGERSRSRAALTKLVAGLIELDGGKAEYPSSDDARASRERIHLHATIKRVRYDLHLVEGVAVDGGIEIVVPNSNPSVLILAVVRDRLSFAIYEVDAEIVRGTENKHAASMRSLVPYDQLRNIEDFTSRL